MRYCWILYLMVFFIVSCSEPSKDELYFSSPEFEVDSAKANDLRVWMWNTLKRVKEDSTTYLDLNDTIEKNLLIMKIGTPLLENLDENGFLIEDSLVYDYQFTLHSQVILSWHFLNSYYQKKSNALGFVYSHWGDSLQAYKAQQFIAFIKPKKHIKAKLAGEQHFVPGEFSSIAFLYPLFAKEPILIMEVDAQNSDNVEHITVKKWNEKPNPISADAWQKNFNLDLDQRFSTKLIMGVDSVLDEHEMNNQVRCVYCL